MKVPSSSNVIAIAHGKGHQAGKNAKADLLHDNGEKGENSSQVTVLFPRSKPASAWQKTHKSQSLKDSGSDQQKASDPNAGMNLFGSLIASVEQKLSEQNGAVTDQDDPATIDAAPGPDVNSTAAKSDHLSQGQMARASKSNLDFSLLFANGKMEAKVVPVGAETGKVAHQTMADGSEPAADEEATPADLQVAELPKDGTILKFTAQPQLAKELTTKSNDQVLPGASQPGEASAAPTQSSATSATITPLNGSGNSKDASSGDQSDSSGGAKLAAQTQGTVANNRIDTIAAASFAQVSGGTPLSPVAQIVENIRNAVPVQPAAQPASDMAPAPVKTLEIQLQPEGLGAVTVTLKSEQGKMRVQISAKVESTRVELERNSADLINGLQKVDASFKDADVNFSNQNQNQGSGQDPRGQSFGNGSERRPSPEFLAGAGSNGGQDARQSNAQSRNPVTGNSRLRNESLPGELPADGNRSDGIYL